MDLFVLDFEKRFQQHLKEWMLKNKDKFPKAEQMEAQVERVYERWLRSPAEWLGGHAPLNYFDQFDNADMLVKWMLKYITAGVWVPDPMLDRIVALGQASEGPLLAVKRREAAAMPAGPKGDEAVMIAIKLLNEVGSRVPMEEYIDAIIRTPDGDYAESMAEALMAMGPEVVDPVLARFHEATDPQAREWLLSVLAEYPGDKRIYDHLLQAYQSAESDRAILAAYLGKYGNADAIPHLLAALKEGTLNYLEWTETKNAVEELGGEVNVPEPDFAGDPWFESLKYLD